MAVPALIKYVAILGFVDHAHKKSRMEWNVSAGNYNAWITDTSAGSIFDLFAAAETLTLDEVASRSVSKVGYLPQAIVYPTDEAAVNSAKLIALGRDTVTGKPWKQEIPARNTSAYTSVLGNVDLTGTAAANYVTDILGTALSEDGNAVAVSAIKVAGKGTQA